MREERADVCVIGSGAGGALIAYEAARRGHSVLVLERGPNVVESDFSDDELVMIPKLYKDGGLQMNTSHDLFLLQGSCVGGSTVLSNMVLLRAEPEVFAAWRALGSEIADEAIGAAYDEVEADLRAAYPAPHMVSKSAERFMYGARSLGLSPEWMLKALGDCKACGLCNVGCPFGTKRSSRSTYLAWAEALGVRVLAESDVTRLVTRGRRIDAAEVGVGRGRDRMRVRARLFVVAAGAIGSSAVLLKSGIRRNVGTRVSMNAGAMMVAEFDETLDAFDADQMTVYLRDDEWLVECTHNPVMSAALTTPGWFEQHGALMAKTRRLAYAGGMVGTAPVGKVFLSRLFGGDELTFELPRDDLRKLKASLSAIAQVFFAAGARRVVLPAHHFHELHSPRDVGLIDRVMRSQRDFSLGSAHPQGGNPLAEDPGVGVVGHDFGVHGFDNLSVFDASVFPTSVRVNPVHTLLALGKCAAPRVLARA